jgi:ADP-ribose pyrophosphatase YjhB (NUDIX family)
MSRLYPDRPVCGVGAVVWRDGQVLLVRRANPPRRGEWSLPGGAQEIGETVFEAVRREVLEETGIPIEVLGLVDVVDSIHRDEDGRVRYHYTLADVFARAAGGGEAAAGDATEAAWFDPGSLPALWPETERIIRLAAEMWSVMEDTHGGDQGST